MLTCSRYHDFSAGHRVVGHETKCKYLHGHNYRVTFVCACDELDGLGRVIDFSAIKSRLCQWLEDNWDHRMILWDQDPYVMTSLLHDASVVTVPFNPTAEKMAEYLLDVVGPIQLEGTGITLAEVEIEETRKCSAKATAFSRSTKHSEPSKAKPTGQVRRRPSSGSKDAELVAPGATPNTPGP